jgi:hypothetical protein
MPVEQQRCAPVLHRRRKRLDVIDLPALVGCGETQQDSGDVGRAERIRKLIREPRHILRDHEIKARGGAPRFGRSL